MNTQHISGIIYRKYDIIRQNGITYTCAKRHISNDFKTDLTSGLWYEGIKTIKPLDVIEEPKTKLEKSKMQKYIVAPIAAILFTIAIIMIVATLVSGCSSQPPRMDLSLVNCINSYKRDNPAMSTDLAYSYCSAMQGIVEKK